MYSCIRCNVSQLGYTHSTAYRALRNEKNLGKVKNIGYNKKTKIIKSDIERKEALEKYDGMPRMNDGLLLLLYVSVVSHQYQFSSRSTKRHTHTQLTLTHSFTRLTAHHNNNNHFHRHIQTSPTHTTSRSICIFILLGFFWIYLKCRWNYKTKIEERDERVTGSRRRNRLNWVKGAI